MEKFIEISEDQYSKFMSISKEYNESSSFFIKINRTKNGYTIKIEGQPNDIESFITELENNYIK